MIIGLVGFASSGKGTVADYLDGHHSFTKMAFADPLKDAASVIFDWPRKLLEGDTVPSRVFREKEDAFWTEKFGKPFTPRMALQKLGTEACRNVFDKNIWVYLLEKRIRSYKDVVVTDVRFPNEIEAIVKMGGHILRIKRGPEPVWLNVALKENKTHKDDLWKLQDRRETMEFKYPEVHVSEWAWIGHPCVIHTIHNDSSLDALFYNVDNYLLQL